MNRIKRLIAVVFALLILCGCSPIQEDITSPSNSQTENHFPPVAFVLTSNADVETILNADNMSDTKIDEFISQHKQQNGPRSKSDMVIFSEILQTVGYPLVNCRVDENGFGITMYPETGEYTVIYIINGISYRFDYVPNGDYVDPAGRKVMGNYEIDGIEFPLYQGDSKILINYIYANGYRIRISAYRYENVSDISFEPFSWSTDMKLAG